VARLRPLSDEEFEEYLSVLRAAYVEDMVESGFMDRADAEAKADGDIETQLAGGVRTPDTYLYAVQDDTAATVGYAWMAKRPDQVGRPVAFVFDIWLREEDRGRGLGRAAMIALEKKARELGLDAIRLNVFGHNKVARELYNSLGYDELSVLMGKSLTD
jgi:ribosomal protein S18 acetylase RimI-like enzyme